MGDSMKKEFLDLGKQPIANGFLNKDEFDNEFFFDYLKKEIKPKRKMGHLTVIKKII